MSGSTYCKRDWAEAAADVKRKNARYLKQEIIIGQ
jgi:hypothetical protein